VGYDHIDLDFAKENKIRVGHTPEVLTDATADMAFGLLLDSLRRISEGDRIIRKGKWKQIYGAHDYVGFDLQGKTLGIMGLGRIGKTLAKRAKAFDMKIIYHNRNRISRNEERKLGVKYAAFDKLITQSDIISIHVPHTKETNQIFNMKILKKMKKTAFLINTSRGKVVNEKDLVTALKQKIIAGAGIDVFETEPIEKNHPFMKLENLVMSPHVGSSTKETNQIFNMKILKKMKKTAFLINTSRGKVVNEKDLVTALKQKIIAGAGIDVFETEPIKKNHPFMKLENLVMSPHVGSSTKETRIQMAELTVKNLIYGMNGKKPIYSVGY
jgi:glyoxylate reductase